MDDVNKKPAPLRLIRRSHICCVCGNNSYSLAGIHPQCAARAADKVRMDKVKAAQLLAPLTPVPAAAPAVAVAARYQKICARCRKVQHVRRKTCECGHVFTSLASR